MRVVALNDVHGNLPALEAVLAEIPEDAAIVLGGDIAAGPFPAGTLEPAPAFPAASGTTGRARPSSSRSARPLSSDDDLVVVGRVGRSHGLDGSFFVEDPSEVAERFQVGAELHV